jgi:hypothetical protein
MFRAALLSLACLYAHPTPALAQDSPGGTPAVPQVPESASEPEGLIGEPRTLERVVIFLDRHFGDVERTGGLYADLWNMIPGAGWIAGGPGYRQWYATDRVFVDASAAISWRGYKTTQARVLAGKPVPGYAAVSRAARPHDDVQQHGPEE